MPDILPIFVLCNVQNLSSLVKLCLAVADLILGWQVDPSPPPIIVDNKEHYEVKAILDSCIFYHKL